MKINKLKIRNYRTLENLDLHFSTYYCAICGKNDCGKTNIVRVLRGFMKEEDPYSFRYQQELSVKEDFCRWIEAEPKQRKITIAIEVTVDKSADTGLYEFLATQLKLESPPDGITLCLQLVYGGERNEQEVTVQIGEKKFEGLNAQEVLRKFQTSRTFLFYNSTELDPRFRYWREFGGFFPELSGQHAGQLESIKLSMNKRLRKIAKDRQEELTKLLGRLEEKYKVSLSIEQFDLDYLPFSLTLRSGIVDVSLNDWGSGTRNRTLILLTLFLAKEISQSVKSASKITPIIVIEEPESFLHPSAQAEFGKIIQDLSEEFKVQVITTTHSPYMLSQEKPESNILLKRNVYYKQLKESVVVDTSGANWMEPFGLALGVENQEFEPWRKLFFSKKDSVLLVEGDIDKEYFELLRDPVHGTGQLKFEGEIFPYEGKGTLSQPVVLKFIKDRCKKIFITYDLDAEPDIERCLIGLGFERNTHYSALGQNLAGKKNIEGLLPDQVTSKVLGENPGLVQQAMNGTSEEKRTAKQRLKRLLLEEFKSVAVPGNEFFGKFYEVTKIINKANR
ncbi:MAG TPA: AAA family ATPase [Verrucomicrobiae bacterium]|nr:AAA family ATPase [Verrucomicrobiae bacterium]